MKFVGIFFWFCAFIIAFSCFSLAQTNQAVPRFETSDCAVPVPKGERVECGYLIVRENRTIKNSRTIRLPAVILKSDDPKPEPDPILRTLGGPGGSSLRMINGRRFAPWLKNRDMIIFEQRGTKYAQPALECPEVSRVNVESVRQKLGETQTKSRELEAVKICRARLVEAGVDLEAYNSFESAADIEDLRQTLKLEKINLYGVSYSARLMLNVMRDYPQAVRSVALESTMPLEINYDEKGVENIASTLTLLFSRCRADAECAKSFPNLETEFYRTVKKANAAPFAIDAKDPQTGENVQIKLTGNDIVTWAIDYLLSSEPELTASAPLQMSLVSNGDLKPLQNFANDKLSPSFYSLGMRYSVWCREEAPFENARKINAQSNKFSFLKGYEVQTLPAVCPIWNIPKANPIENKAVKSQIPTLILAGEFDAYTPPDWGRQAAKNLKNSFFFEIPWLAHGPGFSAPPCLREMVAEFFDKPQISPKSECIEQIRKKYKFMGK